MAHWGLVIAVVTAIITGEDERTLHLTAGFSAAVIVACRIVWGFVGSPYARFAQFVKSPAAVNDYLDDLIGGREEIYIGHNPAGGAMVVAMLALLMLVSLSGIALTTDAFWGSDAMELIHGRLADVLTLCTILHVTAVVVMSGRHKENLVWSMISGQKRSPINPPRNDLGAAIEQPQAIDVKVDS